MWSSNFGHGHTAKAIEQHYTPLLNSAVLFCSSSVPVSLDLWGEAMSAANHGIKATANVNANANDEVEVEVDGRHEIVDVRECLVDPTDVDVKNHDFVKSIETFYRNHRHFIKIVKSIVETPPQHIVLHAMLQASSCWIYTKLMEHQFGDFEQAMYWLTAELVCVGAEKTCGVKRIGGDRLADLIGLCLPNSSTSKLNSKLNSKHQLRKLAANLVGAMMCAEHHFDYALVGAQTFLEQLEKTSAASASDNQTVRKYMKRFADRKHLKTSLAVVKKHCQPAEQFLAEKFSKLELEDGISTKHVRPSETEMCRVLKAWLNHGDLPQMKNKSEFKTAIESFNNKKQKIAMAFAEHFVASVFAKNQNPNDAEFTNMMKRLLKNKRAKESFINILQKHGK